MTRSDQKVFLIIFVIAVLITLSTFRANERAPSGGELFLACLKSKGVTMFGTDTCPSCQKQKELLGEEEFKQVSYVNCDINPEICTQNNIKKWPTWLYNGQALGGVQTSKELAQFSGCDAP